MSTIRWIEARPDALTIERETLIMRREWDIDQNFLAQPVGEVMDSPKPFLPGFAPVGSGVDHVCGTDQDFREGGHYEPALPPFPYGASGLPVCCSPAKRVYGGGGSSGRAVVRVKPGYHRYGGAGASGKSAYNSKGYRLYGGAGASGDSEYTRSGGYRLYGGAGASGDGQLHCQDVWERNEPGNYTFTATMTGSHVVELWGGGAGGADNVDFGTYGGGGGGGGGAYARSVLHLVAGTDYSVNVGNGGAGGGFFGGNGDDSDFNSNQVLAKGGTGGPLSNPGHGGAAADCIGDYAASGGDGYRGVGTFTGGGGGAGASWDGAGASAVIKAGGGPHPGGGRGGDGAPPPLDTGGSFPAGAGGGATQTHLQAGDGAFGRAVITWGVPCS